MKVYGISKESLYAIVKKVSDTIYSRNVIFKKEPEQSGSAVNFSLRILDCSKLGSRRSNTGRKIPAACWHVHRDIMSMIFQHNSDARIVSMLADYRGINDFEISFPGTGSTNWGSIAVPIRADRACNCAEFCGCYDCRAKVKGEPRPGKDIVRFDSARGHYVPTQDYLRRIGR